MKVVVRIFIAFLAFCITGYNSFVIAADEISSDTKTPDIVTVPVSTNTDKSFKPQILKLQIQSSDNKNPQNNEITPDLQKSNLAAAPQTFSARAWKTFKGKPMDDSLNLGMWSHHFNTNSHFEQTNNLFGAQYKGYAVGYLKNSYDDTTIYLGVSRKMWEKQLTKNLGVNFQYKAGIVHGYGDRYPNIGGVSPAILPLIGVTYRKVGFDLLIAPSNRTVLAGSFRLNLPKF